MNQLAYTSVVILLGLAVSFIGLLLLGAHIFEGEAAMGVGILWGFSIPAYLLIGIVLGRTSYRWYSNQNAVLAQITGLFGVAVALALVGPALTTFMLWARSLFW